MVVRSEASGAAKQHAGPHSVTLVDVKQLVGQKPVLGPPTLREVRGELDSRLGHSMPPSALPSAAAPSPVASPPAMFSHARRASPSSAGRCVSSIQVENVVYEPSVAV